MDIQTESRLIGHLDNIITFLNKKNIEWVRNKISDKEIAFEIEAQLNKLREIIRDNRCGVNNEFCNYFEAYHAEQERKLNKQIEETEYKQ